MTCRGFLLGSLAATLVSMPHLSLAAPSDPDPAQARVFKLDFRQIAASDGSGSIMDAGFISSGASSLYWYQTVAGKPALHSSYLPKGDVRDLTSLMPADKLPDAISWSPDGQSFVFAGGTTLNIVATKDGSRQLISTGSWTFDSRHVFWQDQGHILADCNDGSAPYTDICSIDLASGKVTAFNIKGLAPGLPFLGGYFPGQGTFVCSFFDPGSASAVFVAKFTDIQSSAKRIPFPELGGDSTVSATEDGKYMMVDTHMGDGDSPVVILIGSVLTGNWARIEPLVPMGQNIYPKISPDGKWVEVISLPDGQTNSEISRLYVDRIPQSLLDYLNLKK